MARAKSKFDVADQGVVTEIFNTIKFAGFVIMTFLAWFFYGALVRRAYKKACDEKREYCVDKMPSGKRSE